MEFTDYKPFRKYYLFLSNLIKMKKQLILFAVIITNIYCAAQTQLHLKINHKAGTNPLAFSDTNQNNLSNSFTFSRIQYYLTVVSITHDGGTITPINKVLLVDASSTTLDSLTSLTITNLEKVTLAVGVHSSLNHLDPSLYAVGHPLAPKSPSMHWGWTPGYRFVAMEGTSLSISPTRVFELHSLGDASFFYTTIATQGIPSTNKLTIEINADYLEALRGIDVSNGPLNHGESAVNKRHLDNFRDYVFTSVEGNPSVGIRNLEKKSFEFTVSPNPSVEGNEIIVQFGEEIVGASLVVCDLKGSVVFRKSITSKSLTVSELKKGSYICTIRKQGASVASRKLIITH